MKSYVWFGHERTLYYLVALTELDTVVVSLMFADAAHEIRCSINPDNLDPICALLIRD